MLFSLAGQCRRMATLGVEQCSRNQRTCWRSFIIWRSTPQTTPSSQPCALSTPPPSWAERHANCPQNIFRVDGMGGGSQGNWDTSIPFLRLAAIRRLRKLPLPSLVRGTMTLRTQVRVLLTTRAPSLRQKMRKEGSSEPATPNKGEPA